MAPLNGTPQHTARAGELRRQFVLGDGIKHVQTTAAGDIWVGYFDEGVYGNYGWGNDPDSEPIGADRAGSLRSLGVGSGSTLHQPNWVPSTIAMP